MFCNTNIFFNMRELNLLQSRLFMLTRNNVNCTLRTHSLNSLLQNFKILNQSQFANISSISFPLKDNKSDDNELKNKKREQVKETKPFSGKVPQSSDGKKKCTKVKILTVKPEISNYDLQIKFKQLQKFIEKGMLVNLKVDNSKNLEGGMETILDKLEKFIVEGKIPVKLTQTGPVLNIIPVAANEKLKQNKGDSSDLSVENKNGS